jgi:glycosyltransferase involved in cell wall biosynthesis
MRKKPRILYIYPDTVAPASRQERNALSFLAHHLRGDFVAVLVPTSGSTQEALARAARAVGDFRLSFVTVGNRLRPFKKWRELVSILRLAHAARASGGPYDAIVSHGAYRTGIAGTVLSLLWRTPLIVELPGHPTKGLRFDGSLLGKAKRMLAPILLRLVLGRAAVIRLLYPAQLDGIPLQNARTLANRAHVFHEFVAISGITPARPVRSGTMLFVGFPFQLKGVDLLIDVFLRMAEDFPHLTLKIVGFCPDLGPWRQRARHDARVQFLGPQPNESVVALMGEAAVLVLPSRTEAMGRVLLEAMAAGTPVVASDVDGIPHYVRDGIDGQLFKAGDSAHLEEKLRAIFERPERAQRMAAEARVRVTSAYSERTYAESFHRMVVDAIDSSSNSSSSGRLTTSQANRAATVVLPLSESE